MALRTKVSIGQKANGELTLRYYEFGRFDATMASECAASLIARNQPVDGWSLWVIPKNTNGVAVSSAQLAAMIEAATSVMLVNVRIVPKNGKKPFFVPKLRIEMPEGTLTAAKPTAKRRPAKAAKAAKAEAASPLEGLGLTPEQLAAIAAILKK